jgi:hypothetical protein
VLSARSIVKSFGPTSVLRGFDLSIAPGEVHARAVNFFRLMLTLGTVMT